MKETFPGYYRPTETEFQDLWDNCLFVVDANVLLNLYQYSVATREELLSLLRELSDRLWLPHQAGLEYQRNRLGKIDELVQLYSKRRKNLAAHLKEVDDQLRPGARHPFVKDELLDRMTAIVDEIDEELAEKQEECRAFLDDDPVRPDITVSLDGKVGPPYSEHRMGQICKEGEARYKQEIPPGYLDKDKDGNRQYGDLVLWLQTIDKAKEEKKPVILVTDDRKEDWWEKHQGETVGPRPELIQEMKAEAGVDFYIYRTNQFVKHANKYLTEDQKVSEDAIGEIGSIRVPPIELPRIDMDAMARAIAVVQPQFSAEHLKALAQQAQYQKAMMEQIGFRDRDLKAFMDAVKYQKAMMDQIGFRDRDLKAFMDAVKYQKAMMGSLGFSAERPEPKSSSEDAIPEATEPSSASDGAISLGLESQEQADVEDSESESQEE